MKKWIMLIMAFTLVFTLAACGTNNNGGILTNNSGGAGTAEGTNSGGDNTGGEKEAVTLRMAWWGGQPRNDYTLEVIKMYEEKNPHVTIEPEYANWDDYWKKLAPQAAANELPDIIQMDLGYITQYGTKNQLADLTPFLNNGIDVSNIADTVVNGGKLGDKLYGFNAGVNALQIHYDPEMLKKIGMDSIPDDWTWDDYKELAKKAGDAGIFFDTGQKPEVFFSYYLRQNGQKLYSADGTQLGYDNDQLFIDYFGMTQQAVLDGGSPTPDFSAQIKGIEDDPVVKEQGISVWQWSNQFIGLQQVANRPLEMHPLPGPNVKEGMFLKPSMFWSVSENSNNKEEAVKFIDFFINDIEANKLIKGERGVPVSSVVKEALKPLLTPEQVKVFDFITWAEENSTQMDPPDPIGAAEVMNLFKTYDEQMKFNKITPEEAAKKFREEANAVLAKNKQ
ncbi:ABC transporter substrate-binding protein [Paenibacillus abyssi]|uniref:ABC transporter substrate-binding protein YesO n=1 Tax=Paenibacillus abyssi TaxID=1340531 RepID=A0A917CUB9_9BACL|nr:extracellular solute-binding protein [Paenibacillus abyssi]GGF99907.1 putative ABC transporter substrate-binding protein YesO [Paenibacillus abyssi]